MSSLDIRQLNLQLVMLETAYARLEARIEARFEGSEAATEQPVQGNLPDVNCLQPVIGGNTIPRPSPQGQPNSWVLSAGSVTVALVLHFTRGNIKEARLLYSAIDRLAHRLVQITMSYYHTNGIAIPSWGSLAPNQRNILVRNLEERAARRNIALDRFENSWVSIFVLSQRWRTAVSSERQ
ncbi:hypothetical protein PHYBLDRAFT_140210 [Phycomyces blakesleeanus NRRL 1555(-)]|uniref:Uncharacterized protein n=1 Tax=Phycomyces blakesleeanus (strain ATCC 8743b / DSM 1359 / FGSC 10004 / NBRC 33097 / NRRL 1555) TaxID=763407 RepID=A0A162Q593_PHYB8|nr:hypothetical protein PHYBLDRAFT_140210 [Phycomyces blakesleeanus NRRL 1555(-)]OAD80206.1 hypothetical protein PHYBLDRAFT_140210 [Phycomyces blakesleeanus NRRL 1555(-)]|eukprot:XP_018298246.1 hypothetical protein PHYBLDRAFT_140210 [Phycomyces blakesleeanus NRRL 1555(-)]